MPDSTVLKSKPWDEGVGAAPADIFEAKGMIGPEERRCYYWLARHWATGRGCIVDAGAFVGASTYCFAAGAAAAGRREFEDRPIVHAYDYFKVIDQYVGDAITQHFGAIGQGESYLQHFEKQTAPFSDMIRAYPGDFLSHQWNGLPIEILFVDIAKTAALNSHVIAEFFPSLIPGKSIIIHQDYYHCWHPYIHISMEYFDEEFELVDELVRYGSRVWRLAKPIPPEKIARMNAYDLTSAEKIELLDRVIAKSSEVMLPMMEVVRIWQFYDNKDLTAVWAGLDRMQADYGLEGRNEVWAQQALRIRTALTLQGKSGRP